MKKILIICSLLALFIITMGCQSSNLPTTTTQKSSTNSLNQNKINQTIDLFLENKELEVNTLYSHQTLNQDPFTTKKSLFRLENKQFLGYSLVTDHKNENTVTEYYYENEMFYQVKNNKKTEERIYKPESILEYLGFSEILIASKNLGFMNNTIKYSTLAGNIMPIVQFLVYDLNLEIDYNVLLQSQKISYEIVFEQGFEKIVSIILDLSPVYTLVENGQALFASFSFKENSEIIIPPVPDDDINEDPNYTEELKKLVHEYLDLYFQNKKEINYSFMFPYTYFKNMNVSFSYQSSNTFILKNNGEYIEPITPQLISLQVKIYYSAKEIDGLTYNFTATAKNITNGIYSNPLLDQTCDRLDLYTLEMMDQYGDSLYFNCGNIDILIDAGTALDGSNVRNLILEKSRDRKIELLIVTHPHSDHIGGIMSALQSVAQIDRIVDYGYNRKDIAVSTQYENFVRPRANQWCAVEDSVNDSNNCKKRLYVTKDLFVDFLDTSQYIGKGDYFGGQFNESSVTNIITFKNIKYYMSGDLDNTGENKLSSGNQLSEVTVMKATHHGTKNGNSVNLISKLRPKIVLISAALEKGNSNTPNQMHPTQEALNRLKTAGRMYCNFVNGTILLSTDGLTEPVMTGSPTKKGYLNNGIKITGEENIDFRQSIWYKKNRV